jgi:hypothetical protein
MVEATKIRIPRKLAAIEPRVAVLPIQWLVYPAETTPIQWRTAMHRCVRGLMLVRLLVVIAVTALIGAIALPTLISHPADVAGIAGRSERTGRRRVRAAHPVAF